LAWRRGVDEVKLAAVLADKVDGVTLDERVGVEGLGVDVLLRRVPLPG
jgi:hypothetical protein